MTYAEEHSRLQERIWMQHLTELSLTFHEARILIEMIASLMDEGLSEGERIVVHFTGGSNLESKRFIGYSLDTISTILDAEIVKVDSLVYQVPRLIEAERLVEYSKLVHDIMQ